jgi:hypothetical protein
MPPLLVLAGLCRMFPFTSRSTKVSEQFGATGPLAVRQVQNTIWAKRSFFFTQAGTSFQGRQRFLEMNDG